METATVERYLVLLLAITTLIEGNEHSISICTWICFDSYTRNILEGVTSFADSILASHKKTE